MVSTRWAPVHNARIVTHYLNERFPNSWIGTNGPVNWPPRSPCLNPLDYFLWGLMKNRIYNPPVKMLNSYVQELWNSFS